MQKNQLIPSVHSWDIKNFRVERLDWPYPFLTMSKQKIFNQLSTFNFVNLHQHAKNEVVFSICFGEIVHSKIIQSDWLRGFWPISQKQRFSQILDLCRNTANNKHFHYWTNSMKINTKFFFKSKKLIYGLFPRFLG